MKKRILLSALLIWLSVVMIFPASVHAQEITILSSSVKIDFPLSIVFNLSAQSADNIVDARLNYVVEQRHYVDLISEGYVAVTPATSVDAQWVWDMRQTGGLPPGSVIQYWWTIKGADGSVTETVPTNLEFNDNRYTWRNLQQGQATIYWYQGDDNFAQQLMDSTQQALASLEQNTGAKLSQPIKLYIYGDSRDLQGALVYPQDWTGGVAFPGQDIVVIGISPAMLNWGIKAITHELTHLVINQVTFNPYNGLPTWLDEGLAMYNEGPLDPEFTQPLGIAINQNKLISVRSLASPFSAYSDQSILSYAESYSIVSFLISRYGEARMFDLLNTFHGGSAYDAALEKVYGFDMEGLNNVWQNSLRKMPVPVASASSLFSLFWATMTNWRDARTFSCVTWQ